MAQIGRENRKLQFDALARPISSQQRLYCETMSEIMETRTRVVRWPSQADLPGKLPENRMDILDQQLASALRDKEVRANPPGGIFVAPRRVVEQDFRGDCLLVDTFDQGSGCRNFIGTRNAAKLKALRGMNNRRRGGLRWE